MTAPAHRVRRWSEARVLKSQTPGRHGKPKTRTVQVYLWECTTCVKDGVAHRGTTTLFMTKREQEIEAHTKGEK